MDYTLIKNANGDILTISRSDGASIPIDMANSDYQRFLEEADGMTLEEVIIPNPQPDTTPSLQDQIDAILELI